VYRLSILWHLCIATYIEDVNILALKQSLLYLQHLFTRRMECRAHNCSFLRVSTEELWPCTFQIHCVWNVQGHISPMPGATCMWRWIIYPAYFISRSSDFHVNPSNALAFIWKIMFVWKERENCEIVQMSQFWHLWIRGLEAWHGSSVSLQSQFIVEIWPCTFEVYSTLQIHDSRISGLRCRQYTSNTSLHNLWYLKCARSYFKDGKGYMHVAFN